MRADDVTSRPARHVVHLEGQGDEARVYRGNNMSMSIDIDNQCVRLHDEVTPGGYACLPFFPAGYVPPNPPAAGFGISLNVSGGFTFINRVAVNVPFTNVLTFTVTHNRANFPVVQIIDTTTMEVIDAEIVHTNNNQFVVNFTTPTTGIIVF